MNKELNWLLKDKYNFSDSQINDFLLNRLPLELSSIRNDDRDVYAKIQKDLERLQKNEPINYIIGWQDFLDCKIDLSLKPLIPRVETEYWVKQVIDDLNSHSFSTLVEKYNFKILDLCCGSGCIGIAILKHIPSSTVTFSDISKNAILQTKINLEVNLIPANKYKIIQSDLFEDINEKFDIVFANPPYVNKNGFVPDSLRFEPEIALYANNNGFEIIYKILDNFEEFLNTNGELYMEFGLNQDKDIKKYLENKNQFSFEFMKDQYKVDRVLHYRLM